MDDISFSIAKWTRPTKLGEKFYDMPHCDLCGFVPCNEDIRCPNCGAYMINGTRSNTFDSRFLKENKND